MDKEFSTTNLSKLEAKYIRAGEEYAKKIGITTDTKKNKACILIEVLRIMLEPMKLRNLEKEFMRIDNSTKEVTSKWS